MKPQGLDGYKHSSEMVAEGYALPLYTTSRENEYYKTSKGDVRIKAGLVKRHDVGWVVPCAYEADVLAQVHEQTDGKAFY